MKTTIDLPDDVVREVKLRAVMQGRTVKDLVADLLKQGLGIAPPERSQPEVSSRVTLDDDGLPVVDRATRSRGKHVSVERALKLEQKAMEEEDLKRAGIAS